jgi:hypothetical protein
MKLIDPIFNEYRALEIYEYIKETLEDIKKNNFLNSHLQSLYNKTLPIFEQLDKATYRDRHLPLTDDIKKHDLARDHAYSGLRLLTRSYTHHYNTALATAAKTLLDTFKKYPDAIHEGYNEESGIIANLCQDLLNADTPGRAALNTLDTADNRLLNWVENLRDHNTTLRELLDQRYAQTGTQADLPLIKDIRPIAIEYIGEILNQIAALATARVEAANSQALLATVNARTEKYNQVARERRTIRHEKEQENTP